MEHVIGEEPTDLIAVEYAPSAVITDNGGPEAIAVRVVGQRREVCVDYFASQPLDPLVIFGREVDMADGGDPRAYLNVDRRHDLGPVSEVHLVTIVAAGIVRRRHHYAGRRAQMAHREGQ